MLFLRTLPDKLLQAMQNISNVNANINIVRGTEESINERLHVEYAKLWCAMRYRSFHWESIATLRTLLASIENRQCNYDVPLFSQYADFDEVPKPGKGKKLKTIKKLLIIFIGKKSDCSQKAEIPSNQKDHALDFIEGCNGVGQRWFHLPAFTSRPPVYVFHHQRQSKKRLQVSEPEEAQPEKRRKIQSEDYVEIGGKCSNTQFPTANRSLGTMDSDSPPVDLFTLDHSPVQSPIQSPVQSPIRSPVDFISPVRCIIYRSYVLKVRYRKGVA